MAGLGFNPSYGQNAAGQYDYNPDSDNPADATNYYASLQQAMQAAASADPQYAAQINALTGSGPQIAGASSTTGTGTASGLPTSTQVASAAPASLQSFGALPSVTPTYADPNQNASYMQQYEQLASQSLQPTFQSQDQNLQDSLAARGISSSGAAQDLTNQLYGQQAAAVASAQAPIVSQGYGYTQQDIQGNQTAANSAAGTNAEYDDQALTGNATTYNNYINQLEQQGYNTSNELLGSYIGSYNPSAAVGSAFNTATGGIGSEAGNAFNTATNQQNQETNEAFTAFGAGA